jgi:nitrogen fixation protein FixH
VSPALRWTLIVVGLLVGNLIAMAVLIVSSKAEGAQVIPAYYERATRFDGELDDAERARELSWDVGATLDRTSIVVEARDAVGLPIVVGRVYVRGFHRAHASARFDIELRAIAPGRFAIERTNDTGVHDLEITVERGNVRFVAHRVVEAR